MNAKEAYTQWRQLGRDIDAADKKMLKVFSHPEATDERIVELARMRAAAAKMYKQVANNLLGYLQKAGEHRLARLVEEELK